MTEEAEECPCTDTLYDNTFGHTICTACGKVLEEHTIAYEVSFGEKSSGAAVADGFFIGQGQARAKSAGYNKFGMSGTDEGEKHAVAIQSGNAKIRELATQVGMSVRHVEIAERYYKLAVVHGFIKGRKTRVVAACCLYIVCRLEKTSHMLMDFADVLEINVYSIGTTYMRLVVILNLRNNIQHIDPCLYIQRFASKLEFEEKNSAVVHDSLRLISRMDRDWIKLGRRPAGICAAALFIAARMHGFNRTVSEIVHIVKICSSTLRKRLIEFGSTESANLTVDNFSKVWIESSKDPPSFSASKNGAAKLVLEKGKRKAVDHFEEDEENPTQADSDSGDSSDSDPEDVEEDMQNALQDSELLKVSRMLDSEKSEDLSLLDDDWEVANAVITPEEASFKSEIWESLNFEYNEIQKGLVKFNTTAKKQKKAADQVEDGDGKSSRKRGKGRDKKVPLPPAHSALDATATMLKVKAPALSSKINYNLLKDVLG